MKSGFHTDGSGAPLGFPPRLCLPSPNSHLHTHETIDIRDTQPLHVSNIYDEITYMYGDSQDTPYPPVLKVCTGTYMTQKKGGEWEQSHTNSIRKRTQ